METCPASSSHKNSIAASSGVSDFNENRFYLPQLLKKRQNLLDHYELCVARLRELTEEVDSLRRENCHLRLANTELVKHLSSQAAIQHLLVPPRSMAESLVGDFRRLGIGGGSWDGPDDEEAVPDICRTSVIENSQFEGRNADWSSVPKSISVRSSGYLKLNKQGANSGSPSSLSTQPGVPSQLVNAPQRVYVPGDSFCGNRKREVKAIELEVYNQGMYKTELCNKWNETGTCPYGNLCRFAHGMKELRPVIRHPRYKTEICRMVVAGGTCPYGHRCHFRHSLSEHEQSLGSGTI